MGIISLSFLFYSNPHDAAGETGDLGDDDWGNDDDDDSFKGIDLSNSGRPGSADKAVDSKSDLGNDSWGKNDWGNDDGDLGNDDWGSDDWGE